MCGIVGAVSADVISPALVECMRDQVAHRGPDHAGVWLSRDARVGLGHRRLAIVDLLPEANQPFISSDGRYVITFNGEIYNFLTLRTQLMNRGVSFRTRSDTEVLVEAYRLWGTRCLEQLSGMFVFALWDTVEKELFCARDRAGEKPFYYALIDGSFVFGSELKVLVEWPNFTRAIDYTAVVDYFTFGYVPDPKSIWQGCYKLPPAHYLMVKVGADGELVLQGPQPYWDFEFEPDHSVGDWSEQILGTLQSASAEMAFADVPVGSFLSGGVDSSSVTAALGRNGFPVTTFTIGFEEEGYDERRWARMVAEQYQTTHIERVVTAEDVSAAFQKLLWHYDEPFNDYSYLPTYYLSREARKHITVALSGDGGDELFAGYRKYRRLGLRSEMQQYMLDGVLSTLGSGVRALLPTSSALGDKLRFYQSDVSGMLTQMLTTGLSPHELRGAARGELAATLQHYNPLDTVAALLRKAPPDKVGLINSMRYLDLKLTLAGDMLVKVDRASMAVALEVRPVYLHRDMLDLARRIPPQLLVDKHQSKKVLKTALKAWLPDEILHRQKMGFAMPLGNWINRGVDQLIGGAADLRGIDELVDTKRLMDGARAQADGKQGSVSLVHSLFFFNRWLNMWQYAPAGMRQSH